VPEASGPGRELAQVLAIVKNYGFAYRMGTVKAITEAAREALGADAAAVRLIVDASHNMLQPETVEGERLWVSRANCCRPADGRPGIVAGDHQVPSCLIVGPPGCEDRLSGYDHGIGHLLAQARSADELTADGRGLGVERLRMVRGTTEVDRQQRVPLPQTPLLEETMERLAGAGFAEPVAYLRPIANLKHRVRQ
jgi:RNA-splicing ligase RtcB